MTSQAVLWDLDERGVARVTLNRPRSATPTTAT
jgi:hypothetical protein